MMLEPTLTKLHRMKLSGMIEALTEQNQRSLYSELSFEERLGLIIDREMTAREKPSSDKTSERRQTAPFPCLP